LHVRATIRSIPFMKYKCLHLIAVLLSAFFFIPAHAVAAQSADTLVISEVQTGGLSSSGTEDGKMEFIELYNASSQPVELTGWHLEYLSASHTGIGAPTHVIADLTGSVQPSRYVLLSNKSYLSSTDIPFGQNSTASGGLLARSGGHIRLVSSAGQAIDLVAWGNATKIGSWWKSPEIPPNFSIQRQLDQNTQTFDSATTEVSPRGGGWLPPEANTPVCNGVVLSEVLPNPGGADTGREYIELYNPTDAAVNLAGCSLYVGETDKAYAFPDETTIAAGAYMAFYDTQTGLTLPNATAQAIHLVTTSEELVVSYTDNMPDDTAWAYVQGSWQATNRPTPGAPNAASLSDSRPAVQEHETMPALAACPAGKERNAVTNRCRTIPPPPVSAVCKPGQERNPDTGRCKTQVVGSLPAACKPNQERNPETNRCKASTATASVKTCPQGQIRNTETNRCRKANPSPANLSKVADVTVKQPLSSLRLWIIGIVGVGAIGYAAYEWRTELYARWRRVQQKRK